MYLICLFILMGELQCVGTKKPFVLMLCFVLNRKSTLLFFQVTQSILNLFIEENVNLGSCACSFVSFSRFASLSPCE